jgi:hypothetical protein
MWCPGADSRCRRGRLALAGRRVQCELTVCTAWVSCSKCPMLGRRRDGRALTDSVEQYSDATSASARRTCAERSGSTRRSAELARRYRLDQTLAAAVALEAYAHARLGRRTDMQQCIDDALAPGVRDIEVKTSSAAAFLELVGCNAAIGATVAQVPEPRPRSVTHLPEPTRQASTGPAQGR